MSFLKKFAGTNPFVSSMSRNTNSTFRSCCGVKVSRNSCAGSLPFLRPKEYNSHRASFPGGEDDRRGDANKLMY